MFLIAKYTYIYRPYYYVKNSYGRGVVRQLLNSYHIRHMIEVKDTRKIIRSYYTYESLRNVEDFEQNYVLASVKSIMSSMKPIYVSIGNLRISLIIYKQMKQKNESDTVLRL